MEQVTQEQVDEMVRAAVERTEKSFGGTFKRMKVENEEMRVELDAAKEENGLLREEFDAMRSGFDAERAAFEEKLAEAGTEIARQREKAGACVIREEVRRQLAGTGPLPERFIPLAEIPYAEDPEALASSVADAIGRGRAEFAETLREAGIPLTPERTAAPNPTNPAIRNGTVARDLKSAAARDALRDMTRRGLLR